MQTKSTTRNALLTALAATVAATGFAATAHAATPVSLPSAKAAVLANAKKTQKPAKVTTVKCFRQVGGSARCEITLDYGYRVCRDNLISVRRGPTGKILVVGLAPTCKAAMPIEAPDEQPTTGGTTSGGTTSGGTSSTTSKQTGGGSVPAQTAGGPITEGQRDQIKAQKAMYGIAPGTVALDMSRFQYDPAPYSSTGPDGQGLMANYWVVVSGGRNVAIDVQYRKLDATGTWVNAFAVRSVGGSDDAEAIDNFM
jgi:hypothetical protein